MSINFWKFCKTMGMYFLNVGINMGIHYASWVAHPDPNFSQVPPLDSTILD